MTNPATAHLIKKPVLAVNADKGEILVVINEWEGGEFHTAEIEVKNYTWSDIAELTNEDHASCHVFKVIIIDENGSASSDHENDIAEAWLDLGETRENISDLYIPEYLRQTVPVEDALYDAELAA